MTLTQGLFRAILYVVAPTTIFEKENKMILDQDKRVVEIMCRNGDINSPLSLDTRLELLMEALFQDTEVLFNGVTREQARRMSTQSQIEFLDKLSQNPRMQHSDILESIKEFLGEIHQPA